MGQGANFCGQGAAPFQKILAGALHKNINLKPYAKYQNPSSGGYQDIVLTRFFY